MQREPLFHDPIISEAYGSYIGFGYDGKIISSRLHHYHIHDIICSKSFTDSVEFFYLTGIYLCFLSH